MTKEKFDNALKGLVELDAGYELVELSKMLGGGELYKNQIGRYCFCTNRAIDHKIVHSEVCDLMNDAISKAESEVTP